MNEYREWLRLKAVSSDAAFAEYVNGRQPLVCGSFADRLDEGHRQWLTGMRRHQRRRTVVCAAPGHKRDLTKANSPEATTGRVGPHPIRQRVGCAVASGGTHCAINGPASWRQPGRQVVA